MSDSFADLWASSAPSKSIPQQPQKKPESSLPPRRPQYDAFSILSASQPPFNKSVTNTQRSDRQGRQPQPNSRGGDAFSGLFDSSVDDAAPGRNPDRANMTMAERAVLAQKAKAVQSSAASTRIEPTSSSAFLWDGLDALARPTTASPSLHPTPPIQGNAESFDFGFNFAPEAGNISSTTSPPNKTSIEDDDWGLSEFTSPPPESRSIPISTKPTSAPQSTTLWDLEEFASSQPHTSQPQPQLPSRSLTGTPGDFDFGDREDGPLSTEDTFGIRGDRSGHAEDDILGDLGKPVSHSHSPSPNTSTSARAPVHPLRTSSPPPHIIGQLVEMGFPPFDARAALVNTVTESGFDVQAATELLLSQAGQDESRTQAVRRSPPTRTDSHAQPSNLTQSHLQSQAQGDITAEKLMSQASEIGRSMFSKANALWKEGKEKAVKMYEERAAVANPANGALSSDGRPRWMRDRDQMGERQRLDRTDQMGGGFRDDDEEQGTERKEGRRPPARHPPPSQPHPPPAQPEREREVDLFSADSPTTVYQSRFRRGKSKSQVPPTPNQLSSSTSTLPTQTSVSTSSGLSTMQRPPPRTFTTTIAFSALTSSASQKSAGTDAYKRGDFPVALAAYMRALSALPSGHILQVPILTNVALVRFKLGELRDTIKACEEAIVIVRQFVGGTSGEMSRGGVEEMSLAGTEPHFDEKTPVEVGTGKVSVSVQGDGGITSNGNLPTSVDLIEGLSKAFRRRAEAFEGLEKWEMARSTWEVFLGAEWASAGAKGEAVKGVGRCRRMVDGDSRGGPDLGSQSAPPKPKPKTDSTPRPHPKPKPIPKSSTSPPSAALTALRDTHNAQETEDVARLACKDSVDANLTTWKSGREGNIRALLTSLDETVLWPELGWRKVGMAEVVSKGQVKGAYVRAIAKVHPDKLNAGNTTVEQRMIANGVFGALNEAWNAFQQQQQ